MICGCRLKCHYKSRLCLNSSAGLRTVLSGLMAFGHRPRARRYPGRKPGTKIGVALGSVVTSIRATSALGAEIGFTLDNPPGSFAK